MKGSKPWRWAWTRGSHFTVQNDYYLSSMFLVRAKTTISPATLEGTAKVWAHLYIYKLLQIPLNISLLYPHSRKLHSCQWILTLLYLFL